MDFKNINTQEIIKLNEKFKSLALYDENKLENPHTIISWILEHAKRPVVSTNFRPYEAAILHACTHIKSIRVIWCDTGYNTRQTYLHKIEVENLLHLNIKSYAPQYTSAYLNVKFNGIPEVNTNEHTEFTKIVKLNPFNTAMKEHSPDVWFTNIRQDQTDLRNSLDVFSLSKDCVLKVSPFYYWSDKQLDTYLEKFNLPNEKKYFDPTKVLENRECGLHE